MALIGRLAVLTDAVGLVWLVKGLEVEDVDAPGQQAADGAVPVCDGVVGAGDGGAVVGAAVGRPARLAVPELGGCGRAGDGLDVLEGLHHVVEVGGGCVADFLRLPVGEAVDEAAGGGRGLLVEGDDDGGGVERFWGGRRDLHQFDTALDDRVGGSIGVFVPAVGCADQGVGEQLLDLVDLSQ